MNLYRILLSLLIAGAVAAQDPAANPPTQPPPLQPLPGEPDRSADEPPRAPTTPEITELPAKLLEQVPDPVNAREYSARRIAEGAKEAEKEYIETGLEYINTIDRPHKIELSLEDAVRLTLENNYFIRARSYDPAIQATEIVAAEAVFDAVFFSEANINENNTPTASTLVAADSSFRDFLTAIVKPLPTGGSAQAAWSVTRQERDLIFDQLNPQYTDAFIASLRQPLLRGFGLDYNRAPIEIARINRSISVHAFRREVQDRLLATERAYWRLVTARRNLVIAARLIADFQEIFKYLYARRDFDASPVEISLSQSRLEVQIASFVQVKNNVKDAEDVLKAAINAPELNLADDIEIIPTTFPTSDAIVVDRLAELQDALDHRNELREAELAIESAKIGVGRAKNETLPLFDVNLTYTYDSLGKSQHDAFQNLSDLDFHTYTIGLRFEWPIGNRGARARLRQARLRHTQAMAQLKAAIENILLEVNIAVRNMYTNYEQIGASLNSVYAQMAQVEAIQDRAERRDPNQLNLELNAKERLAGERQRLLQALVDYNIAFIELERAKGTLLEFNNITVTDVVEPYAPLNAAVLSNK